MYTARDTTRHMVCVVYIICQCGHVVSYLCSRREHVASSRYYSKLEMLKSLYTLILDRNKQI